MLRRHGHLPIDLIAFFKGHGPRRLQQPAAGAGGKGHPGVGPPAGVPGAAHGHHGQLLHGMAGALELEPVPAEGVGIDQLRPGLHIGPVDVCDPMRIGKAQKLRDVAQLQALLLEHGAHAAV